MGLLRAAGTMLNFVRRRWHRLKRPLLLMRPSFLSTLIYPVRGASGRIRLNFGRRLWHGLKRPLLPTLRFLSPHAVLIWTRMIGSSFLRTLIYPRGASGQAESSLPALQLS